MTRLAFTPGEGGGKPAKPESEESQSFSSFYLPYVYTPTPAVDQPAQPPVSPHDFADPPTSYDQAVTPKKISIAEQIRRRNQKRAEQDAAAQNERQSAIDIAQDIKWSPEDEASGLVSFMQATAQGTRGSSADKTTAVCEALYAAHPEAVARGLKIMTGCEPDDEEQDVLPAFISLARSAGMGEYLTGVEAWYTTRHGPSEPFASSTAEEESLSDEAQVAIGAGNSESTELNRRLRYSLTERFPDEWTSSLSEKKDLENHLLIPKLRRFIHGFDEDSVNWDEFTLQESIDFYLSLIAGELHALSTNPAVSDEYFQELQAEYAWAADLQALAKPIPLDDTAAYTEVFDVGAEGERTHVENQLAVIYEYLDITPTDDYFASRSTADLKYELYSLLIHNVIPLRGSDLDPLAAQLFRSYSKVAGVSPFEAVDRLQGTYREPDVLGFLFVVGLTVGSMVFEPLDWALTTVDIINALSEGDIESAIGNFIVGALPFANSRMDDAFRLLGDLGAARRGGPLDHMPVYFANPAGKGRVTPTSEFAERLMSEHDNLHAKVAEDAVRGAERVKGTGVGGADILLPGGVEREITVHTGRQENFFSHLISKSRQFSDNATRKEVYIQVKPRKGVVFDKRRLLNDITDEANGWQTKSALPDLDGVYVKVFGPDGEVWWDGKFTVELYE